MTLKTASKITAKAGATVKLSASAIDPDKNELAYRWWNYAEVGTYKGTVTIKQENQANALIQVPIASKKGDTIHIILEVTDKGSPALTRYQRVVITVE